MHLNFVLLAYHSGVIAIRYHLLLHHVGDKCEFNSFVYLSLISFIFILYIFNIANYRRLAAR
jgi:hypothetical protein